MLSAFFFETRQHPLLAVDLSRLQGEPSGSLTSEPPC